MQNAIKRFVGAIRQFLTVLSEFVVLSLSRVRKAVSKGFKTLRYKDPIVVDIIAPFANRFFLARGSALMMFMLIVAVYGYGQDVPAPGDIDISTPAALFGNIEALFSVFVIIGGYLTAFIPGLKMIKDGTLRVLAWAVITAIGFLLFDSGSVLSLSVTYAISTSLYEVILQWFRKSPKPGESLADQT